LSCISNLIDSNIYFKHIFFFYLFNLSALIIRKCLRFLFVVVFSIENEWNKMNNIIKKINFLVLGLFIFIFLLIMLKKWRKTSILKINVLLNYSKKSFKMCVCVCLCSVYCKIIQKMYKKTKTVYKCVQKVIYIDEFKLKLKKKSDIYIKNICILFQLTLTIHQINT